MQHMNLDNSDNSRLNKIGKINEINEMLKKDVNIVSYLTDNHKNATSVEDEMISYDLRAGVDTKHYRENPELYDKIADKILSYIDEIDGNVGRIVECGSGEGIVLSEICKKNKCKFSWAKGIDISWSRTAYAREKLQNYKNEKIDIDFVVADFFHLPLKNDSIDVVYTMQGIYGMGGYEEILLKELYRCCKKYLILVEPCYEMAGAEARDRMDRLGYVKGLKEIADSLNYKIVKYELFGLDANPLNPAAVMIIEKDAKEYEEKDVLCCPFSYGNLEKIGNSYYCDESKLSYPILNGIACLTRENAIVTSQIKKFLNNSRD